MWLTSYDSHAEIDSEGSWAISYGDLLTLLTCFLIMFFSAEPAAPPDSNQVRLPDLVESPSVKVHPLLQFMDEDTKRRLNARIKTSGERLLVDFWGTMFFSSGQVTLTDQARQKLSQFFKVYEPFMGQYHLAITAFSDPRPLKPTVLDLYKDNLQLSTLRALSVVRYLERLGVPLKQMRIQGFGELALKPEDVERIKNNLRVPASVPIETLIYDWARTIMISVEPKSEEL